MLAEGLSHNECMVIAAPGSVDVHVTLVPELSSRDFSIDDVIAWIQRDPHVGDLLREYEEIVHARGPDVVEAVVAEGKRFLESLPAGKAVELMSACAAARARLD